MKMVAGLLMCAVVGFFVFFYAAVSMSAFSFYSNAASVTMTIDRVSVVEKFGPGARVGPQKLSGSGHHWEAEVWSHYDSERRYLQNHNLKNREARLLLDSQGKSLALWILPNDEHDTYFRFQNDFPIGAFFRLIVGIVIFLGGLYVVLRPTEKGI